MGTLAEGHVVDGKYRIVRLIGQGGMGSVWEAEHVLLGRRAALKVLAPEFTHSAEAVRRFVREARAAAQIGHENICEVTDIGQTDTGMPYIVMQLLKGRTLSAAIAEATMMSAGRTVDIGSQILDGLQAAHDAGIVHRDMKPDNVFLVRAGGQNDFVKLLDFGISKVRALGSGNSTGILLTQVGTVMGTPSYMSPEQARGEIDVDARTDVWAVGVILYEMLSGKVPFSGENYNQVMYQVLAAPIPPLASIRPTISPELDAVVMRALERDAEKRFASAAIFKDALLGAWVESEESGLHLIEGKAPARAIGSDGPVATPRTPMPRAPSAPTGPALGAPIAATRTTARGENSPKAGRTVVIAAAAAVVMVIVAVLFVLLRGSGGGGEGAASPPGTVAAGAGGEPDAAGGGGAIVETAAGSDGGGGGEAAAGKDVGAVGEDAGAGAAAPGGDDLAAKPGGAGAGGEPATGGIGPAAGEPDAGAGASAAVVPPDAGTAHPPGDSGGRTPARDAGVRTADVGPAVAPPGTGTLSVYTTPETEVLIDGVSLGRTPIRGKVLPAGRYGLEFVEGSRGIRRGEPLVIVAGRETVVRRTAAQLGAAAPPPPTDARIATPPAADAGGGGGIRIRRDAYQGGP